MFWESVFRWGALVSEIIIGNVVSWKQLSTLPTDVLLHPAGRDFVEESFSLKLGHQKGSWNGSQFVFFLDLVPQQLPCGWFAWLEWLVKVLSSVKISDIDLLCVIMYHRFPLIHEILFFSFFQLFMGNLTPSNIWTCNTHWHRYFAGLIEKKKRLEIHVRFMCLLIYNFYL